MALKQLVALTGFALLFGAVTASAQTSTDTRPVSHRPRIEVRPAPRLLYRRCTDWYEIQYRPSGTVLFPAKHCWWVRG